MVFRKALLSDIEQMQMVRNSVKENMLSDPGLVPDRDYVEYLTNRGAGWVCIIEEGVVGFAIADVVGNNIWALFVHPEFEKRGIGKTLHDKMLNWYFSNTNKTVWLSTAPASRAEGFYRQAGWQEAGTYGKGEIKFEMNQDYWNGRNTDHGLKTS